MYEVFRHFQTNETSSDDNCASGMVLVDPGLDLVAVRNVSQLEDTREIAARKLGNERLGTRGENQVVVGLFETRRLEAFRIFTFLQKLGSSRERTFSRG